MNLRLDESQFDKVLTVYEFATEFADAYNIKSKLVEAKVERHDEGYLQVVLRFEREAHALTGDEVAEFMDVNYVLLGTYANDGTWAICGVGAN